MSKPATLRDYLRWARLQLDSDFNDTATKDLYNAILAGVLNEITTQPFLNELDSLAPQWQTNYRKKRRSTLFMGDPVLDTGASILEPQIKPYSSAVDKSFRTNVLWNSNYPKPPEGGWVTSENIHKYFDDAIRGTIVCKFIDGPGFIIRKLVQLARQQGVTYYQRIQAKEEGYYAYHFYTVYDIPVLDWRPKLEIQVTTQLQDVMRDLTHRFYEARRLSPQRRTSSWKWDYKDNEFKASYLSHALHLLEAYVIQSRDDS